MVKKILLAAVQPNIFRVARRTTTVTWAMIGKDFEAGLANLNAVAEK